MNKNWVALETIVNKEITRCLRIWTQTILPPAITMTLYFLIFGKLIGSQIHQINGYTYMQYIVPGLTMMAIMTNAYANTSSSFFGAKFSKSIEEMLVSSMPNWIILLGYVVGGTVRGLLIGILVILIATFFTHIHIYSYSLVIIIALFSSMLFSVGGIINGIYAKKFDDVSFIPTFVLTPLTYLGGVFFSVHQLPPFWQKIALFNPILNIVDSFRFGMLGITDFNIYLSMTMITGLLIFLFLWCLYLMEKGVGLRT